jgi:hypothetical protein
MTLATIQDFLKDWPGWANMFLSYGDETSGVSSGVILVKELRPALWILDAQSVVLKPSQIRYWMARLASLENGNRLFYGFDMGNYYPIAYPGGTWPSDISFNGTNAAVNSMPSSKSLTLNNLPPYYVGTVGDMISVTVDGSLALHQVVEAFEADGSGVTTEFEVRPAIRTGMDTADAVAVKRPACKMMLVPGSLTPPSAASHYGTISFKGIQVI